MSLLMESGAPAPLRTTATEVAPAAGGDDASDALLAEAFGFTITHRGAEEELVMGDVTLCCSTTCSSSGGGGRQQPR
ncbi:hypothetical protein ACR8AL_14620 [Clavibacter sepedonicus]|nr:MULTISPECIES: hypothetical protein [Clavibacter]MBD5381318.1 hypothetical protein [Clavibacter sp.]OQJ49060.1 hypothetical protein B5P19_13030 [Clavibacter sepedonicus]OQJ53635.1 hypothetical protein B5P20_05420 [Clavibacter sepedonicus]UUK65122.1 hypothetical protein LRE50_12645 [Clavibacter sepedonicus]